MNKSMACSSGFIHEFDRLQANCEVVSPEVIDANNVKYWGAVGDGVTDDYAAFAAALANGSCVKVPPGSYFIGSTLTVEGRRTLQGCGNTEIFFDADIGIILGSSGKLFDFSLTYIGSNASAIAIQTQGTYGVIDNVRQNATSAPALTVGTGLNVTGAFLACSNSIIRGTVEAITVSNGGNIFRGNTIQIRDAPSVNVVNLTDATDNKFFNNTISSTGTTTNGIATTGTTSSNVYIGNTFTNVTNDVATLAEYVQATASNGEGIADVSTEYRVAGTPVVKAQVTGWAAATGTATRTTFDTATVTTAQLAERVKALIDDLGATAGHGLIDA
jgi:hypothetical protein